MPWHRRTSSRAQERSLGLLKNSAICGEVTERHQKRDTFCFMIWDPKTWSIDERSILQHEPRKVRSRLPGDWPRSSLKIMLASTTTSRRDLRRQLNWALEMNCSSGFLRRPEKIGHGPPVGGSWKEIVSSMSWEHHWIRQTFCGDKWPMKVKCSVLAHSKKWADGNNEIPCGILIENA